MEWIITRASPPPHRAAPPHRAYSGDECRAVRDAIEAVTIDPMGARVLMEGAHITGHPLPGVYTHERDGYRVDLRQWTSDHQSYLWAAVYGTFMYTLWQDHVPICKGYSNLFSMHFRGPPSMHCDPGNGTIVRPLPSTLGDMFSLPLLRTLIS